MAFPLLQANTQGWSREEEAKLKQLARHNTVQVLSLILGRPESGILTKAQELNIRLK